MSYQREEQQLNSSIPYVSLATGNSGESSNRNKADDVNKTCFCHAHHDVPKKHALRTFDEFHRLQVGDVSSNSGASMQQYYAMTTENIHHASLTGSMPTAYRPPTAPSATSSSAASSPKPDMERFWNMMLDSSSLPLLDDTLPNPTHFDSRPNYAGEKEKSVQKMFPRSISPEIVPSSSNQSLYSGTDEEESGGSSGANGSIGDERDGHHGERSSSKDDKRRRNTAASARFRIKKKMREQALQRTANEMTEKSIRLEARVQELEREIRWLKALVVEKNESRFEKMLQDPHHARSLLGGVELTRQPDSSYQ